MANTYLQYKKYAAARMFKEMLAIAKGDRSQDYHSVYENPILKKYGSWSAYKQAMKLWAKFGLDENAQYWVEPDPELYPEDFGCGWNDFPYPPTNECMGWFKFHAPRTRVRMISRVR